MSFFQRIINIGTHNISDNSLKNYVITSNIASLLLIAVLALPYSVITYFTNVSILYIPIGGVVVGVLAISFNHFNWNLLGRLIISMAPVTLSGLYHAYLVPASDMPLVESAFVTFAFALTPFIVFKINEPIGWVPSILYASIWVVFFSDLKDYFESEEVLDYSFITNSLFSYLTSIMAILFGGGGVFALAYQNMIADKRSKKFAFEMYLKQKETEKSQFELKRTLEEIESKKAEEELRMWANDGMVRFTDILRNNTGEELYMILISELVKYVGAKQGKFYLANGEGSKKILQLVGFYAYDRYKYEEEYIEIGDGLIGECFQEGGHMHITEIPEDYVTITSGLGEANPKAILIFPLMNEEVTEGIIEIASFNEFTDFQIDFLKRLGVNIATTIAREKINSRTSLLLEESKQQTEMMQQQEEEMRQNMEEMKATQDMLDQREQELLAKIKKSDSPQSYL